jgi:hypothetical protein
MDDESFDVTEVINGLDDDTLDTEAKCCLDKQWIEEVFVPVPSLYANS